MKTNPEDLTRDEFIAWFEQQSVTLQREVVKTVKQLQAIGTPQPLACRLVYAICQDPEKYLAGIDDTNLTKH